jgi:hypothetical protein
MTRTACLRRFQLQNLIAVKTDGTPFSTDELAKMDLPVLKMLANNARRGGEFADVQEFTGTDGKPLTGDALTEAGFAAAGYDDLRKMV